METHGTGNIEVALITESAEHREEKDHFVNECASLIHGVAEVMHTILLAVIMHSAYYPHEGL